MIDNHNKVSQSHLFWVSTITPATTLDSATWLDTSRELRRLGWRVTLIGMGPKGRQRIRGVELLCLPRPQVYFLGMLVFHSCVLHFLLREWANIDVILFHQISAIWILPLRVFRLVLGQHRPLLIMDTRDFTDLYPRNFKHLMRRLYNRLVYWLAAYLADGQTTITQRMARYANIPSNQLLGVWPSGVNLESFSSSRKSRHWPAVDEPIKLIYIGMFARKRNLSFLCQAVQKASLNDMLFTLTLVGDGEERTNLESIAQNSSAKIHILSPVLHEQIPGLLAEAHIGVTSLPNPDQAKYQASSPIKLFEYMAAGLPILSTSNVCHTEVVGDGNYAFWANSADEMELLAALQQIWHCRANLAQMGAEAAFAAKYWTWEASAKKLSDALERGMANRYVVTDGGSFT